MSESVLIKRVGSCALVQLNRPKALNALSLDMIRSMYDSYKNFESEGIQTVVLEGLGGKAFCAGGDVRAIYDDRGGSTGSTFFAEEYRLNHLIGSLKIPHVAFIHGFVMGGGVGVSVHGKYRVATEKTQFSMPETALGLFPDVGGSIFLPKLPGELGTYLGLTGHRLKGYEAVAAGVATHFVSSDKLESLKEALLKGAAPSQVLDEFHESQACDSVAKLQDQVDKTFNGDSVEAILSSLEKDGSDWAKKTIDVINKASPTSVKVTLRMLREAPKDPKECFALEFQLGHHFLEDNDFYEGVRAILVDKDNKPAWNPSNLKDVNVDKYFKPLNSELQKKLKFHH